MNSLCDCCSLIADNHMIRAGLAIGEHGKEHSRTEIMASQLLFFSSTHSANVSLFLQKTINPSNENEQPAHLL